MQGFTHRRSYSVLRKFYGTYEASRAPHNRDSRGRKKIQVTGYIQIVRTALAVDGLATTAATAATSATTPAATSATATTAAASKLLTPE